MPVASRDGERLVVDSVPREHPALKHGRSSSAEGFAPPCDLHLQGLPLATQQQASRSGKVPTASAVNSADIPPAGMMTWLVTVRCTGCELLSATASGCAVA